MLTQAQAREHGRQHAQQAGDLANWGASLGQYVTPQGPKGWLRLGHRARLVAPIAGMAAVATSVAAVMDTSLLLHSLSLSLPHLHKY